MPHVLGGSRECPVQEASYPTAPWVKMHPLEDAANVGWTLVNLRTIENVTMKKLFERWVSQLLDIDQKLVQMPLAFEKFDSFDQNKLMKSTLI